MRPAQTIRQWLFPIAMPVYSGLPSASMTRARRMKRAGARQLSTSHNVQLCWKKDPLQKHAKCQMTSSRRLVRGENPWALDVVDHCRRLKNSFHQYVRSYHPNCSEAYCSCGPHRQLHEMKTFNFSLTLDIMLEPDVKRRKVYESNVASSEWPTDTTIFSRTP